MIHGQLQELKEKLKDICLVIPRSEIHVLNYNSMLL